MIPYSQTKELIAITVIIGIMQQVSGFNQATFLKRVMGSSLEPQEDIGGLDRIFYVLSAMRKNMESGVEYADYLDSITPPKEELNRNNRRYYQNHFLRIGRNSGNTKSHQEKSKRSSPLLSRFVRFGKRDVPDESVYGNEIIDKRTPYLRIGKLPMSAFLRYSLRNSGERNFHKTQLPISRSTVLRLG